MYVSKKVGGENRVIFKLPIGSNLSRGKAAETVQIQPRETGTFERGKQNADRERERKWRKEAGAPPNSPTGAAALVRFL